ncbi:MAG: right-handed parallel beta-helix repeat-containing protein [Bacteroidales bacterium]|nr:right-handed parallel beta-helix repeat-containing protein [Bacteroidales bacterium]
MKKFFTLSMLALFMLAATVNDNLFANEGLPPQNREGELTITGYAYLEARFNHANIKINFVPVSPSAVADSVLTNALGYFEINDLIPGVYSVRMSRPGFQTPLIHENLTLIENTDLGETTLYDLGTTVSGNVSGNWSGFMSVSGDITVPNGDSLIIDPGTVIRFLGNYNLFVYGYLAANGAEGDTIVFTSGPANQAQGVNQWQRIRFYDAANDNSFLKYTKVEYANDGIFCEWAGPQVENSLIRRHGRYGFYFANSYSSTIKDSEIRNCSDDGIHMQASYVTAENCTISNFANEGVYMNNYSKLTISSSTVSYGQSGVYLENNSDIIADGCTFSNNSSQGVFFNTNWGRGYIANSSFISNTRGVYLYHQTHPQIINNLFTQNSTGIEYYYDCDALVEGNEFNNNQYGIVFNTSSHYCQTTITKNLIVNNTVDGIHKNSYNWGPAETNPTITYNTVSNNGRHGIYNDMPGTEIITNNIISNNGQWGIFTNIAVETFENNNVYGNTSGAINNLAHFPAATWNFLSLNPNNNATCDIYRNINEDPLFVGIEPQSFGLQNGSKCINGGAEGATDPDGSVSDIGAFPFELGNPHMVFTTGYDNQQVSLEWEPVANDSLVSYKVYYKEAEAENGYTLFGSTANTSIDVTGLTNNTLYDFTVTGNYPSYESQYAPKVSEKPGVATFDYDPGSFSVLIPAGQPSKNENFEITNSGSRDLNMQFAEGNPSPAFAYFDGSGDFISYGHQNHLHGMSALTMECWIYRQGSGHFEFFGKNYRNYQLVIDGSQRVYFYKGYGTISSSSYQGWSTNQTINANQWYHVALTWEGNTLKLYVNGEFVWSATDAVSSPIPDFHLYAFEFGRRAGENVYYMNGRLAEARLWNVARTQDEIKNSMYSSLLGNESGLIGYWPLQDDFNDYSQYGITGTPVGEVNLQSSGALPFTLFTVPQTSYQIAPGQTEVIPITFVNRTDMTSRYFTSKLFSDDLDKQEVDLEFFVQYGETVPATPVYFTPVAETGKPYTIVIKDAKIDGVTIQVGDEIGVFDGELCVGAGIFNGTFNFAFTAWESDAGQSLPGFTPGNPMSFRLYDTSADLETNEAEETWFIGDDTFGHGAFSVVALEASVFNIQSVAVTSGQFNLVSFNLFPRYANAWTVFGGMEGLQIVYNDEGQVVIPGYNINTIGDINFLDGFYLYSDQNETIDYEGTYIRIEDWDITVEPNKWNYISVLSRTPVAVTDVFAGLEDEISIVQAASGASWIPSQSINTIGNMQPGLGYKIALSGAAPMTFNYPPAGSKSGVVQESGKRKLPVLTESGVFNYIETGLPYAVVVTLKSLQESPYNLELGDEIGLFDGNLCVGSAIYDGNEHLMITAWQKDEGQNLTGFTAGNLMSAQVYRQSNGAATKHVLKKFSGAKPYFGEGNYATVVLEVIPSVEEPFNFDVLPNPFKDATAVVLELFKEDLVKVNIYDNTGRLVKTLANDQLPADTYRLNWNGTDHYGKKLNPGVYFIIAETTGSVITEKVIILQ